MNTWTPSPSAPTSSVGGTTPSAVDPTSHQTEHAVLQAVLRHSRRLPGAAQAPNAERRMWHAVRLQHFTAQGAPIEFVLPAFPAKSPNRHKTISPLPDLGEHLALRSLQQLCAEIATLYAPGARITICSDGRVFGPVVGVSDDDVTTYRQALKRMVDDIPSGRLALFNLEDVFHGNDFDMMRDELLILHGRPVAEIRQNIRDHADARALFNGIHRFMFEDMAARQPHWSRSHCRDRSKLLAYRVIQRSNAWSALVAAHFPHALRLSIHPQPDCSDKIGVSFTPTDDPWLTPWHAVAVRSADGFRLHKRSAAEAMGATLSYTRDQLAYYLMPDGQPVGALA